MNEEHVFDMYKAHQDAVTLDLHLTSEIGGSVDTKLHASASKDAQGHIHITLCNLDHLQGANLELYIRGLDTVTKA
jgi:alpha-N-arabinofuranosidase